MQRRPFRHVSFRWRDLWLRASSRRDWSTRKRSASLPSWTQPKLRARPKPSSEEGEKVRFEAHLAVHGVGGDFSGHDSAKHPRYGFCFSSFMLLMPGVISCLICWLHFVGWSIPRISELFSRVFGLFPVGIRLSIELQCCLGWWEEATVQFSAQSLCRGRWRVTRILSSFGWWVCCELNGRIWRCFGGFGTFPVVRKVGKWVTRSNGWIFVLLDRLGFYGANGIQNEFW